MVVSVTNSASPSNAPDAALPGRRLHILETLYQRAGWGIAIGGCRTGVLQDINPAFAAMHGYAVEDLVGQPIEQVFPARVWREAQAQIALAHERGHHLFESVHVRRDGSEFPVLIDVTVVRDENGADDLRVVNVQDISVLKDVTLALRDTRDQLRALSAHHQAEMESERRTIAREMHDELGQLLTGLKMEVSTLGRRYAHVEGMADAVGDLQSQLKHIMTVVRQVAGHLRPPVLELGLYAGIEWLVDEFQRRGGIECDLICPEGDAISQRLSPQMATTAFRCVQESLTNVMRHAQANHVSISVSCQNQRLFLRIADNGVGFKPAAALSKQAFGLMGMRERVQTCGGQMLIISQPGAGTTIDIQMPLNKETTP